MKTIVAGSRSIASYNIVRYAIISSGFSITEVVSGGARGVDASGEEWANCYEIPIKRFPADWDRHGRAAGALRNEEMARYADALVAVWDGRSKGTLDMIDRARRHDLRVFVFNI